MTESFLSETILDKTLERIAAAKRTNIQVAETFGYANTATCGPRAKNLYPIGTPEHEGFERGVKDFWRDFDVRR